MLMDLQYIIERNWLGKKYSRRPAYSKNIPIKKANMVLLSQLPQRRYRITLLVLLNACDATSDPSTFMYLRKSQPNQTSHSTGPPPSSYAGLHERCDQSLWTTG